MPIVSVIIPAYNVESYIEKTITSCLNQTLEDIEVIVVNDGSTDKSQQIIDRLKNNDKRIISIKKINAGVTLARKDGLKLAQGKYIFYLDGDDYLAENALELLFKKATEYDADWVVGDFVIEYENSKRDNRIFKDFGVVGNIDFLKYCFTNRDFYFTGRLIKSDLIKKTELEIPPSVTYGEDNLAVAQLGYALRKAVKVNAPILYYVQREQSVTNQLKKKDLIARAEAMKLLIEFVDSKGIYQQIANEINLFALNEIVYAISTGYVDKDFAKRFLRKDIIQSFYKNEQIGRKQYLILCSALVNVKLIVCLIQTSKKFRNLIKQRS